MAATPVPQTMLEEVDAPPPSVSTFMVIKLDLLFMKAKKFIANRISFITLIYFKTAI